MRELTTYLDPTPQASTLSDPAALIKRVREQIAAALRRPETVEDILRIARIPSLIRGLVRPYVRRALDIAAQWISPSEPDPK